MAAPPLFGVIFIGHSYPITAQHFTQVDATHWVLDCAAITQNYSDDLKEVALFLCAPNTLDASVALGLYVRAGAGEFAYRGCVHAAQPSAVLPLQWPINDDGSPISVAAGPIQIGVSVEPGAEVVARENAAVGAKAEFARRVAADLWKYLASFESAQRTGDYLVVPSNVLDRWYTRFGEKFRKDPDFLTRNAEAT